MRPSALILLALALGAVAAFAVARWAGPLGGGSKGPLVVIAAGDIQPGLPIAANNITTVRWPTASVPAGALTDPGKVVGRVARQVIVAGEPVLEARLAGVNAQGGLSAMIEEGKRAITVRVNDVIAVAGFALPGSYVDVLVSAKDAAGDPFSKIVLDRVKVLAVAQETAADPAKPKVVNAVTLELSPEESEKLDLARSIGTLSLVLRNEFDAEAAGSSGARLNDLVRSKPQMSAEPAPRSAVVRSAAPRRGVEELRGIKQVEVQP